MKLCGSPTRTRTSTRPASACRSSRSPQAEARDARRGAASPVRRSRRIEADLADRRRRNRRTGGASHLTKRLTLRRPPFAANTNSLRCTCQSSLHVQPMCCPGVTVSPVSTTASMCPYPKWPARTDRGLRSGGEEHRPAFDRVDTVRAAGRCAALGPVVADGNVDAVMIGGARSGSGRGSRKDPRMGCCRRCGRTGQPRQVSL